MDIILRHIAITVVAVVAMILCVLSGTDTVKANTIYLSSGVSYNFNHYTDGKLDINLSYTINTTDVPCAFIEVKDYANNVRTHLYSLAPLDVSTSSTTGHSSAFYSYGKCNGYEMYDYIYPNGYKSGGTNILFNYERSELPHYYIDASSDYSSLESMIYSLLTTGDTSGFDCTYSDISGTLKNPIYSTDIGALTGMADLYRSYVEMGNQDSSAMVTERTHHFGWNKMTTTNVNLLKNDYDDVKVQCGIKLRDVVRKNWVTREEVAIDNDDLKQIFFTSPDANASKLFMEVKNTYLVNDILTSKIRPIIASTGYDTAFWNVNYTYDFYFRICAQKNGKWYYGNYVRLDKLGSSEKVITGGTFDVSSTEVTVNEDGTLTDTDNTETGTGATGTGDSYEEAKNDADRVSGDIDVDIDDYISNISTLADEIKSIPDIIAKIFSFLPDWVLTLIALSIGTIAVLMVIKFIRG